MFLILTSLALTQPTPIDELRSRLEPLTTELLNSGKNVGFVVGARVESKNYVLAYGTVDCPTGTREPNGDTIFEIGSITKGFTGVLLAEAIRRGEVNLDRPAQDFLPVDVVLPRGGEAPITLRHLATHRSGLPSVPLSISLLAKDVNNPYADFDREKLIKSLELIKPDATGGKERYSNLGAGLVGIALVHSSKARNYNSLTRQRICDPLGMSDTAEALTGEQKSRLAIGRNRNGKPVKHWDFASLESAGALHSTANDMLTFAAASLGEVPVDIAASILESHKPLVDKTEAGDRTGMFWQIRSQGDQTIIWHNGGTGGFRSMFAISPKTHTAVVLLCAADLERVDETAMRILDAVQPTP